MLRKVSKLRQYLARSDADFEWQGMVAQAKVDELIELHGKIEAEATEAVCVGRILGVDLEEERGQQLALEPQVVRRRQRHEIEQWIVIAEAEAEGEQLEDELVDACLANEKQRREYPQRKAQISRDVNECARQLRDIQFEQSKVATQADLLKVGKSGVEKDKMVLASKEKVLREKESKAEQAASKLQKLDEELKGHVGKPTYDQKKRLYDSQAQQTQAAAKKFEEEEQALNLEQVAMFQKVEQLDLVEAELKEISQQVDARFLDVTERNKQLRVEEKRLQNERSQSAEVLARVRSELATLDETLELFDNERLNDEFEDARQREALRRIGRLETRLLEERVRFGILQEELPLERASLEAAAASVLSAQEKLLPQLSTKMTQVLSFDADLLRATVSKSVWAMLESVAAVGKRAYAPEQQRECRITVPTRPFLGFACLDDLTMHQRIEGMCSLLRVVGA